MASTQNVEQVVCTPALLFPTAFPVNSFQLWKEEQKDVLTICNSSAPWDYRGFDPRSHLANFHVAAQPALQQPAPVVASADVDAQKGKGGRVALKTHIAHPQGDFARNLLVAASAPPAFPGIEVHTQLKIPNPNLEKPQPQAPQQPQQQPQQQHVQQHIQHHIEEVQQHHVEDAQHQQHHHKDHRSWPCPSCKVPFKQASELQAHLSAHTKTEKTVPCDICGKYFASGDRVRIHVKAAHGEKSCSCEICGSGFSYRCKLLDHMRTHTGDRPFHCEVCGKSFSQKNHLTRHAMIHTGERPYPCDFCGRGFYRKDKLTRHRRIHTGERVATGTTRRRGGGQGQFGNKGNRQARGAMVAPQPNNAAPAVPPNQNVPIKLEQSIQETSPSTSNMTFVPSTISPSHFRTSPYKQDWQQQQPSH